MTADTVTTWTDRLGQTYGPGDVIAVATISGRSPQMVFATVLEIRTELRDGTPIVDYYYDYEQHERVEVPSCKVKAQPILDGRGFGRAGNAVTYSIPGNIVKLPMGGLFGGASS